MRQAVDVSESTLRSSAFRSRRAFHRRSLPSQDRMSKAKKHGSPRWKRRSLNCGQPFESRQTISPSRTAFLFIEEAMDDARMENEAKVVLLREMSLHCPFSR